MSAVITRDDSLTPTVKPDKPAALYPLSGVRVPALDGVRGFAILGVLIAHAFASLPGSASGVLGVDLFFVLSGFLITGILLDTRERPGYFRNFYTRRALRLFPLAFLYLAVVAALPLIHRFLGWNGGSYYDGSWWWYTLYLSNLKPGHGAHDPYLWQFWSLSVEEQFYLLWPLVILWLGRRRLPGVCFFIVGASLLLRCEWVLQGIDRDTIYRHTLTRIDALAIGALCALAARSAAFSKIPLWPGWITALVYCGGLSLGGQWRRSVGQSMIEIAFAAVVLYASRNAHGWLAFKPLVLLGKYSYCLYLVHVVILEHVHGVIVSEVIAGVVSIAVSVGIAAISWRFLEHPIERLKNRRPRVRQPGTQLLSQTGARQEAA